MDLETLQELGNQSYVSGTASGVAPGMGIVEVRVGGGEWKGAADLKGDWSEWRVKLDPHVESGNSTIYARLMVSEDSISPVDARRIILLDGDASDVMSGDMMEFGFSVFLFPFLCAVALIAFIAFRERWDNKIFRSEKSQISLLRPIDGLRAANPMLYAGYLKSANDAWKDGESLSENQFRRYVSLSILYTAQGLPQGFTYVCLLYTSDAADE